MVHNLKEPGPAPNATGAKWTGAKPVPNIGEKPVRPLRHVAERAHTHTHTVIYAVTGHCCGISKTACSAVMHECARAHTRALPYLPRKRDAAESAV